MKEKNLGEKIRVVNIKVVFYLLWLISKIRFDGCVL